MKRRSYLVLGLLWLSACADQSSNLEGSISRVVSLEFDRVDFTLFDDLVTITYIKDDPLWTTFPCTIQVDTEEAPVTESQAIAGDLFLDGVVVNRAAPVGGPFPSVKSGTITFDNLQLETGTRITGHFKVIFDDDDEHDLSGEFSGTLREL